MFDNDESKTPQKSGSVPDPMGTDVGRPEAPKENAGQQNEANDDRDSSKQMSK